MRIESKIGINLKSGNGHHKSLLYKIIFSSLIRKTLQIQRRRSNKIDFLFALMLAFMHLELKKKRKIVRRFWACGLALKSCHESIIGASGIIALGLRALPGLAVGPRVIAQDAFGPRKGLNTRRGAPFPADRARLEGL